MGVACGGGLVFADVHRRRVRIARFTAAEEHQKGEQAHICGNASHAAPLHPAERPCHPGPDRGYEDVRP